MWKGTRGGGGGDNVLAAYQRGSTTIPNSTLTVNINEVDSSKCVGFLEIESTQEGGSIWMTTMKFNSDIQLYFQRGSSTDTVTLHWEVEQWENIKSLQVITASMLYTDSTKNITINAVDRSKTRLLVSKRVTQNGYNYDHYQHTSRTRAKFINDNTIQVNNIVQDSMEWHIYVLEYK